MTPASRWMPSAAPRACIRPVTPGVILSGSAGCLLNWRQPLRSAAFHSALALADPTGEIVLESEGVCRGEVLVEPVEAARSYGYNSVFYVREAGCTYAEMSDHQLSKLGSRAKAARLLAPALRELLGIKTAFSG